VLTDALLPHHHRRLSDAEHTQRLSETLSGMKLEERVPEGGQPPRASATSASSQAKPEALGAPAAGGKHKAEEAGDIREADVGDDEGDLVGPKSPGRRTTEEAPLEATT
jgi:ribosomal protein L12E/L44/L45/RPP1/RPP2